ncbi:MAG: hypothetical protein ABFS38_20975, partial [Bacteroidota bacterium]
LTWDKERVFAAIVKSLKRDGKLLIESASPITCEIKGESLKYYLPEAGDVTIGAESKPASVVLNGTEISEWEYDENEGGIKITLPGGEGDLMIN